MDPQIALARARAAVGQGNQASAIQLLRQALTLDPDLVDAHALLALCLVDTRRLYAADHEAKLALALEPDHPMAHYAMALVEQGHKDFAASRERLEQVVAMQPGWSLGFEALGDLAMLEGRYDEARRRYLEALERSPEDPDLLVGLGRVALHKGARDQAGLSATQALELNAEHSGAHVLMGELALLAGRVEEAHGHALVAIRSGGGQAALALMARVKAHQSWVLGLWWRFNGWITVFGVERVLPLLLGLYIVHAFSNQGLIDLGYERTAEVQGYLFLAFALYTWFAPALMERALKRELGDVALSPDF